MSTFFFYSPVTLNYTFFYDDCMMTLTYFLSLPLRSYVRVTKRKRRQSIGLFLNNERNRLTSCSTAVQWLAPSPRRKVVGSTVAGARVGFLFPRSNSLSLDCLHTLLTKTTVNLRNNVLKFVPLRVQVLTMRNYAPWVQTQT